MNTLRDRIIEALKRAPFEELRADAPNGPMMITARIDDLADAVLSVLGTSDIGTEFVQQADNPDQAGLDAFEVTDEGLCRCGHGRADHDAKYADPQCRLCPEDGERMWRHAFTPAYCDLDCK